MLSILRPWTLTYDLDLQTRPRYRVKVNHHAKHVGQSQCIQKFFFPEKHNTKQTLNECCTWTNKVAGEKVRSTGTVHTSAKARLTSVAISVPPPSELVQDRHQNLIICSLVHCQPSLRISCKSVGKFLRKVANRQTDIQRRKHNLLGGGNKSKTI